MRVCVCVRARACVGVLFARVRGCTVMYLHAHARYFNTCMHAAQASAATVAACRRRGVCKKLLGAPWNDTGISYLPELLHGRDAPSGIVARAAEGGCPRVKRGGAWRLFLIKLSLSLSLSRA